MDTFMQTALEEAIQGVKQNHGGPFGAVVVRDGEIVSRAHNRVIETADPTAHAEMIAIREASKILGRFDLSDCTLYTTCEPCPMCLGAVLWARIGKVIFGCSRADAAAVGFADADFYSALEGDSAAAPVELQQMDRAACLGVFREWAEKKDKISY